jgi:hypothetical protein
MSGAVADIRDDRFGEICDLSVTTLLLAAVARNKRRSGGVAVQCRREACRNRSGVGAPATTTAPEVPSHA